MPTEDEKRVWKENAEARLAEAEKERQDVIHRQLLQKELRGEQRAADNKAKAKAAARNVWVAEGGEPAEFAKQWERLWEDMVYQRTLARMASGDPYNTRSSLLHLTL